MCASGVQRSKSCFRSRSVLSCGVVCCCATIGCSCFFHGGCDPTRGIRGDWRASPFHSQRHASPPHLLNVSTFRQFPKRGSNCPRKRIGCGREEVRPQVWESDSRLFRRFENSQNVKVSAFLLGLRRHTKPDICSAELFAQCRWVFCKPSDVCVDRVYKK
jgi:hypothetical protein